MSKADLIRKPRAERRPGHFWADNELLDVYGPMIGAYGVAVYMALARHAGNETGQCWPSIPTIARQLGISVRTVQRALATLEGVGLVSKQERKKKEGDGLENDSNLYTLWAIPKSTPDSQTPPGDSQAPPPRLSDTAPVTVSHTNNTHVNHTQENKTERVLPFGNELVPENNPVRAAIDQDSRQGPGHATGREETKTVGMAHQRLIAKRVELFGKAYQMSREARAAKWLLDNFSEADIHECMSEMAIDARSGGFTPSLELVGKQIGAWCKRRDSPIATQGGPRKRFLTQADYNRPGNGVVL